MRRLDRDINSRSLLMKINRIKPASIETFGLVTNCFNLDIEFTARWGASWDLTDNPHNGSVRVTQETHRSNPAHALAM